MVRAVPRGAEPAQALGPAPLVRSGVLFTEHDPDFQAKYFDMVASSPAGAALPEHAFGVNGWRRRVEEAGADPKTATALFNQAWNSMTFDQRRDLVLGNAVARCYAPSVAGNVADATFGAKREAGAAIASDPDLGYLALGDPVKESEAFQAKLLGPSSTPPVDPMADLMNGLQEGAKDEKPDQPQ